MASWEDDGDKTLCIRKQENPGVGGPAYNKLLAAGDGNGALEDAGKEIPLQSAETHRHAEGTNVILKGLSAAQYNGQGGKIHTPVRSGNTGQDSSGLVTW